MELDTKIHKNELPHSIAIKAQQKWDLMAIDANDSEKISWALTEYFEPFGATTVPRHNSLTNQVEVTTMVWLKRAAEKVDVKTENEALPSDNQTLS
jgi:hypothetical protein